MQDIKNLLNVPVYETDLFIPKYKKCEFENWKIDFMSTGFDHGYISGVWLIQDMPILSRRSNQDHDKWETWMSICPHELESQEICCRYAFGHTVIMGLGMGWVALNTAMNPDVKKVTVIELDSEVIDVFNNCDILENVSEEVKSKIEIVNADALKWEPDLKVDFLYVDIWKNLVEPQTISDIEKMYQNIEPDTIYFWGQELFLYTLSGGSENNIFEMDDDKIETTVREKIKLPIFIPSKIDYKDFLNNAVKMRIQRKLPFRR